MKKTILLSLLSSSLLLSQTSNAGEWAIGGLIGQGSTDLCDFVTGFNCDDSDTSFGINLSYDFSKSWGVELGYTDLGDSVISAPGLASVSASFDAIHLAGTGTVNFNDSWSLTGRLGVADLSGDVQGFSESDTGLFAGASLNYNFNDNLQAQLRYESFDGDADNFALGLKYSFGK